VISQNDDPELECVYENLVLVCQWCNSRKLAKKIPGPDDLGYGKCIRVLKKSGRVKALNEDGEILVRELKLNHPKNLEMRCDIIKRLDIMKQCAVEEWKRLMGFPEALPDLRRKRKGSNSKPDGIRESWFEKQRSGALPETYE